MKNFKLFICIVLTIILFNSLVSADILDGNSLLNSFKDNDHENIQSVDKFFDGYIRGVADSTVGNIWCPPDKLKGHQLQKIIANYLNAYPKDSGEISVPAKDLILDALIDAYPCKK